MIELGKIQKLEVLRETSIGVYLNSKDSTDMEGVLLPQKQVPEGTKVGDEIEVFIYKDSKDRLISTTRRPKITLGEMTPLKVVETTKIGAFLDWGLEKDLFLPFNEQNGRVKKDKEYLVALYIDKSHRLCATMKLYTRLSSEAPYKEKDIVQGMIYDIRPEVGAFVAVDNKYQGLIPKTEFFGEYSCGDRIQARVSKVKEDGKLDLSLRKEAYMEIETDAKVILDKLEANGGELYLNDKSSPEAIYNVMKMSKAAFKRAVGNLLKQGKIRFIENGIELIKE